MKTCTICNLKKPLDGFNNQKEGKFGKRSYCRVCQADAKKKYRLKNKERVSEYQILYRKLNPDYCKDYQKNRRENDVIFRMVGNMRSRICNIIKGKTKKTLVCLGTNVDEFKLYIQELFVEGMSWENYGEWEIDHIKPLSVAKNENEICELNYYTNLRPLWKLENKQKHNKIIL